MMKSILTIGALFAVISVQAASVTWTSGNFTDGFADHNGTKMQGSAYTMAVSFYSDSAGQTLVTSGNLTSPKPNGAYQADSSDSFSASTTYYVKAIISGLDGEDTWQREAALAAFTMPDQSEPTLNFMTGSGFDTSGVKWGDWTKSSEPIPEPTSGMLLLVGMAGLALKRKRA